MVMDGVLTFACVVCTLGATVITLLLQLRCDEGCSDPGPGVEWWRTRDAWQWNVASLLLVGTVFAAMVAAGLMAAGRRLAGAAGLALGLVLMTGASSPSPTGG